MFDDFREERQVRRVLRAISRQRVAMVLQSRSVPVVESSPPRDGWFESGVRTCLIRGWLAILYADLPTGIVETHGNTQLPPTEMIPLTHYRVTEGGWAVLNRSQGWVIATFLISGIGLAVGIASLVITYIALLQK